MRSIIVSFSTAGSPGALSSRVLQKIGFVSLWAQSFQQQASNILLNPSNSNISENFILLFSLSKNYSGNQRPDYSKSGILQNPKPDFFEVSFLLLVPTIPNPDHFSLAHFIYFYASKLTQTRMATVQKLLSLFCLNKSF